MRTNLSAPDPVFVYMTFANEEEARRIGEILVQEHLAAGINLFPGVVSIYWWKGKMHRTTECAAIAQSTRTAFMHLVERVVALHAYEVPCIAAFDAPLVHPPFLDWMTTEASADAT